MKKQTGMKKLTIRKETLTEVGGGSWHRTTLRCHNSYPGFTCGEGDTCYSCVTCYMSCYHTQCCYTVPPC